MCREIGLQHRCCKNDERGPGSELGPENWRASGRNRPPKHCHIVTPGLLTTSGSQVNEEAGPPRQRVEPSGPPLTGGCPAYDMCVPRAHRCTGLKRSRLRFATQRGSNSRRVSVWQRRPGAPEMICPHPAPGGARGALCPRGGRGSNRGDGSCSCNSSSNCSSGFNGRSRNSNNSQDATTTQHSTISTSNNDNNKRQA